MRLVVGIAVCVVAFLVLLGLVVHGTTDTFDQAFLDRLARLRTPAWTERFLALTDLGSRPVLWVGAIGIGGALAAARRLGDAGALIVSMLGSAALSRVVKHLVGRSRPPEALWVYEPSGFAFPSGHTLGAFAFYMTVVFLIAGDIERRPVRRFLVGHALAVSALVAFSRLYLGVHYPTDVLGGALLGTAWAMAVIGCARTLGARLRG